MRIRSLLPVLLACLLAGCAPHLPQSTVSPKSDYNREILDIYTLIFWLAVLVFVSVEGALLYAVFKFRRKPGDPLPRQIHGNTKLEIGWTILPALVLVAVGVPSIDLVFKSRSGEAPPGALPIIITGHQWWFEANYPTRKITTANEIHVPARQPIDFTLKSDDVIHSFWVPQLGGKVDLIPTHDNKLSFTVLEPGYYFGQCAEFCGIQHAQMRFRVIAHEPAEFEAWAARMNTPVAITDEKAQKGAEIFSRSACIGCHTIQGTVAQGKVGPNLTRFGERTTLAAGILKSKPENVEAWIHDPQAIKQGNHMPNLLLRPDEVEAIAAYLLSQCDPGTCHDPNQDE